MTTAPSRESLRAFSRATVGSGVSRGTRTRRRRSLSATSATRVNSVSAIPTATLERVETEQGTITSASKGFEPEETGIPTMLVEKFWPSESAEVEPALVAKA